MADVVHALAVIGYQHDDSLNVPLCFRERPGFNWLEEVACAVGEERTYIGSADPDQVTCLECRALLVQQSVERASG